MGFRVEEDQDQVVRVALSGWDRILNLRSAVVIEPGQVDEVFLARRGDLERTIDHRVKGLGSHDGGRRPGGRRVGTMMGRGVIGHQFWAVPKGGPEAVLVVLELTGHQFRRAVLDVTDPVRFRAER